MAHSAGCAARSCGRKKGAVMLTALRIGNFKAFAESQRIPLRPLTLVYGANSAGKSSILHSLLLAHHAVDKGELDVHRMPISGDSVDLGGFRQYVHRRDVNRRMEWSAEIDARRLEGRLAEFLAPVQRLAVTVRIGIDLDDQGRPLPEALPAVHAYEVEADGQLLLRMSRRRDGHLQLDRLEHEHAVFRTVLRAIVETATTTPELQPSDYEGLDEAIAQLVPDIGARVERLLPTGLMRLSERQGNRLADPAQGMLFPVSQGRRKEDLAAAVRFFLPRTLDEGVRGLTQAVRTDLLRLRYLGPLRSYPPRHLAFAQHHDPNWYAGGGYAWDVLRRDAAVRQAVNTWLGAAERLQTPYQLEHREFVPIDQLDAPLAEQLEAMNDTPPQEPPDPDVFPSTTFVDQDPGEVATRLQEKIRSSDIEKLTEVILIDQRSKTPVSHRDVGIGISQVLPVLVTAYAARDELIAIEQPEIHLHPALQADLGDVLIQSALGDQTNRLLIESHSEHILLRVMRRMRETAKKKNQSGPPVRPEDVAVLYVLRDGSRSVVLELRLDDEGTLLDPWPGGFFEEGFRERFGLGDR
jgi:hypothetical protein